MEKKEYIEKLKKFVEEKNISIYDYYYAYALTIRSNKRFALPEFELSNPFLTAEDITLLLNSKEERIEEYYATVMARVIELNEELLRQEEISRKDIEEVVEEELGEPQVTRSDIKEAVEEELGESQVTRTEIEEVIKEQLGEPQVTRADIEEVVEAQLNQSQVTRTDIEDIINKQLGEKPSLKVVLTSIGRKIADLLNGFAVIKEEKTGRAHLYYHDAKEDSLKGERIILNNKLEANSGYYVNYQEYVDAILNPILEQNPEEVSFVREDGEEKALMEVLEEAFAILRQNGAIRFGKELLGKDIRSYQDILDLQLSNSEEFAGEELKTGIYVRRDILTRIFAKYKIKYKVNQIKDNKENHL